jgi:hypothetical protein
MKEALKNKSMYGDFQTPPELAERICEYLAKQGTEPKVLLEPTCGTGSFIHAALKKFPSIEAVYAVEINDDYCHALRTSIPEHFQHCFYCSCADALRINFSQVLPRHTTTTLVLGNPPWAMNSALQGHNLPDKENIKRLSGLDALTGKSNFDIAEYVMIKLLRECAGKNVVVAMLLKNSVIRNLLQAAPQIDLPISNAQMLEIDTKKYFGVDVAASLFICRAERTDAALQCSIRPFEEKKTAQENTTFGWYVNGTSRFVADVERYSAVSYLDGTSPFEWRQGIKHDAAAVMELTRTEDGWVNKQGSRVEAEDDYIFPLVKSTQLAKSGSAITETHRAVIVPQRCVGEDTSHLAEAQPRLYAYLQAHKEIFTARKSSIYRNKPDFSIFGIGEYSFKPYKIAVSGLHKTPVFTLIAPINGKPVMLDDTSYFLGFDSLEEAQRIHTLLQCPEVSSFLAATAFLDAKRPFTKELLMRVDIGKLASAIPVRAERSSRAAFEEALMGTSR